MKALCVGLMLLLVAALGLRIYAHQERHRRFLKHMKQLDEISAGIDRTNLQLAEVNRMHAETMGILEEMKASRNTPEARLHHRSDTLERQSIPELRQW